MNANFNDVFSLLPDSENPKQSSLDAVPYILHEDHRWVLPMVFFAQQNGLLPRPCNVVMYDRHHDALTPFPDVLVRLRSLAAQPTLHDVVNLCTNHLNKLDDDWLKAGMELGFFRDAVVFGVENDDTERTYQDQAGNIHRIEVLQILPRRLLGFKGRLTDVCRSVEFEPLWRILGWNTNTDKFGFLPGQPNIFLTIDLDCFSISWSDWTFAWPRKIFESEFLDPSNFCSTFGWTGRAMLRALGRKAGFVSIVRETDCSGGIQEVEDILQKLLHYGFDDKLTIG